MGLGGGAGSGPGWERSDRAGSGPVGPERSGRLGKGVPGRRELGKAGRGLGSRWVAGSVGRADIGVLGPGAGPEQGGHGQCCRRSGQVGALLLAIRPRRRGTQAVLPSFWAGRGPLARHPAQNEGDTGSVAVVLGRSGPSCWPSGPEGGGHSQCCRRSGQSGPSCRPSGPERRGHSQCCRRSGQVGALLLAIRPRTKGTQAVLPSFWAVRGTSARLPAQNAGDTVSVALVLSGSTLLSPPSAQNDRDTVSVPPRLGITPQISPRPAAPCQSTHNHPPALTARQPPVPPSPLPAFPVIKRPAQPDRIQALPESNVQPSRTASKLSHPHGTRLSTASYGSQSPPPRFLCFSRPRSAPISFGRSPSKRSSASSNTLAPVL